MKALAPEHREDIQRSGLSETTIDLLQLEAVRPAAIKVRGVTSAYRIPYFTLEGKKNCFERWRLFPVVTRPNGSAQKYHQEAGTAPQLYLPPLL